MGNWTGLGDTLVDCDCKCCLNYAMAAIEANNFNSLSSVAVVKTKQKNKRIETTILYTPFFCCYKSMHNEQTVRVLPWDKASAATAVPYAAEAVCTLITYGSGALPGFNLRCGCTWSSWGQERRKKTYAVQVDSCSCSRRQVDNKLWRSCHKDYATNTWKHRGDDSCQHLTSLEGEVMRLSHINFKININFHIKNTKNEL